MLLDYGCFTVFAGLISTKLIENVNLYTLAVVGTLVVELALVLSLLGLLL